MKDYKNRIKHYLCHHKDARSYGFTDKLRVEFLAQGEYNKNFLVATETGKYVFRINTGSQLNLDNQIEYEYKAIKKLEISGVTPRVFFYDDTRTYFDEGILMMNYLEGRPLDYKSDLNVAASIFARIHTLDVTPFKNTLLIENKLCRDRVIEGQRWLSDFLNSNRPDRESQQIIYKLLDYCDQHADKEDRYFVQNPWMAVNNTEVNSHNFIIGEERSYLIDWEKPVISDPVQDICQFLAPTTTLWRSNDLLTVAQISGFYKVYQEATGQNIEERVLIYNPFLYLRALSWCAGAWLTYTDESRVIRNEQTFKVIENYLTPAFMNHLLKDYL